MPTVQDTFANDFGIAFEGMVANGETSNRISRTIEDADGVGFGRAVFRGAGEHGCTGAVSSGAKLLGWTIADHGVPVFPGQTTRDVFPQYHNVPIMERGAIWVINRSGATMNPGDQIDIDADGQAVGAGDGVINAEGWQCDSIAADDAFMRITNNRPPTGAMT